MKLIDNWKQEFHRLWTIRVGLFFGAFNGAVLGLAGFAGFTNPWVFMVANMVGWGLLIGARMLKQPGANPDDPDPQPDPQPKSYVMNAGKGI